jgi:hypothetical protein
MTLSKNLPIKIGLSLGAALGVVVISIGIIRYKTGMILRGDQILSYVYWGIFALSIFLAVYRFKKLDVPPFSFGQTIKIGLFAGLVSGSMYTLYIMILNNYIDPDLTSKIIQYSEQAFASGGAELSKEEVANSPTIKLNPAVRGLIYTVVCMTFGIVYSLLSTIALKRLYGVQA